MPRMTKLAYKPVSLLFGVLGGIAAGYAFKQLWRRLPGPQDPPNAKQSEHGWREVLAAAFLQGAIFGLVKAAMDRAGARTFEKMTGTWPGD